MTDAEKAALEWLDKCAGSYWGDYREVHARTLKALLAEPRLPHPDEAMGPLLVEMAAAYKHLPETMNPFFAVYRALYVHLTAPKTKTVWVIHCTAAPASAVFERWPDAKAEISRLVELGRLVSIERREVPR